MKLSLCEQKGISFRTNKLLLNQSFSTIKEHSLRSDHSYTKNDFKILYRARNSNELRLTESLFIHKNKPGLNNNETAVTLNIIP